MKIADRSFFLHGVGGMGMLPLALYLRQGGGIVYGHDDALTPRVRKQLLLSGVKLTDVVPKDQPINVYIRSTAIRDDHVLRVSLRKLYPQSIEYYRGEALADIASEKKLLAVAGSHGKTTTTAMLAHLIEKWDLKVDYLIGGIPENHPPAMKYPESEWLVAEIDESDGTIENFHPEVLLLLNFDWDHPALYGTREAMNQAWTRLAKRTKSTVWVPNVQHPLLEEWNSLGSIVRRFKPVMRDADCISFNDWNQAAALAGISEIFFDKKFITSEKAASTKDFADFSGVFRRQTWHLQNNEIKILEDYAHHPREIQQLIQWLRSEYANQHLRVLFQPHRFSRTRQFTSDLADALSGADEIYLFPVYGAGETEETDETEKTLASAIERRGRPLSTFDIPQDWIGECFSSLLKQGGIWAFVGAGDANEWAAILAALVACNGIHYDAFVRVVSPSLHAESLLQERIALAPHTTLKIGGAARIYAEPHDAPDLSLLLQYSTRLCIPTALIGNGSNTLVADKGFEGLVICLKREEWSFRSWDETTGCFRVGAGLSVQTLSRSSVREGWSGFEFLEGIPGTVGGALQMNAGAMGQWMGDRVERVFGMNAMGQMKSWDHTELQFNYRSCPQLDGYILTEAWLRPQSRCNPEEIRNRMREMSVRRRSSQPGGPSAGCMFRNPEGDSAGRLIDSAGLKGLKWGTMQISPQHANFLQPLEKAKSKDVLSLLHHIREKVAAVHGIWLEPEVRLLGDQWPWADLQSDRRTLSGKSREANLT